jgi:uncharacterized membrane protein YidH (DUF202 family)
MKKENLFTIILVFASAFAIMESHSIIVKIVEIILIISGTLLIIKDAVHNAKELEKPSNRKVPAFLENARKPKGKIAFWFMGFFIAFSGILNLRFNFLGASDESDILPLSFQYPFSIVLIILGSILIFIALMKSSAAFSKFVDDNYKVFSKGLFYLAIILVLFIFMSMISPVVW